MSEVQFVGARYVPKFADPIDWDKNKEYEPLTNVRHLETMYISKIPVPTGIEITNEQYWVATANYNAQFESYRQEVQGVKSDLANYETEVGDITPTVRRIMQKKIVFCGDSYGIQENNWVNPCVEYMGLSSEFYDNKCVTGAAMFARPENKFITQIDSTKFDENPEEVTDVCLCGGYNDIDNASPDNMSALTDAGNQFVAACKAKFKNAKVHIYFCGMNRAQAERSKLFMNVKPAYLAIECDTNSITRFWHNLDMFENDGIHPNAKGAKEIGVAVGKLLNGETLPNCVTEICKTVQNTVEDHENKLGGTIQVFEDYITAYFEPRNMFTPIDRLSFDSKYPLTTKFRTLLYGDGTISETAHRFITRICIFAENFTISGDETMYSGGASPEYPATFGVDEDGVFNIYTYFIVGYKKDAPTPQMNFVATNVSRINTLSAPCFVSTADM